MNGIYWLAQLVRGWQLDRNPLRRACDRAETAVLGALLATFLAAVPFGRAQLTARAQLARELTAVALGIALVAAIWLTRRGAWIAAGWLPGTRTGWPPGRDGACGAKTRPGWPARDLVTVWPSRRLRPARARAARAR
jgi:hypothetical protein